MMKQFPKEEVGEGFWNSIEEFKEYEKSHYCRTTVVVDLDAICHNIRQVQNRLRKENSAAGVMAVVKADAYGHGVLPVVEALHGVANAFAVATAEEAMELRSDSIKEPVLILGYVSPQEAKELILSGVCLTVYTREQAEELNRLAAELSEQEGRCVYVKVHLALDTGMTRIGFIPGEEALEEILAIHKMRFITIEGMFTHLACADMTDKAHSEMQLKRYDDFAEKLKEAGVVIPMKHVCNSAAIMDFDSHRFEYVRSGIINYGLLP